MHPGTSDFLSFSFHFDSLNLLSIVDVPISFFFFSISFLSKFLDWYFLDLKKTTNSWNLLNANHVQPLYYKLQQWIKGRRFWFGLVCTMQHVVS